MIKKTPYLFATLLLTATIGCKRNAIDRLTNPNPDGALTQSSGIFVLYDGQVKTGGGLGFVPGGENQSITLLDTSDPRRSTNQIRYSWNGGDVTNKGTPQHLFAGFSFTITPDFTTFDAAQPKNLSGPGYTKLTFFIRGTLSSDTALKIEGPDFDGDLAGGHTPAIKYLGDSSIGFVSVTQALTSDWEEVTLTIPSGDFDKVKTFFTLTFQYNPSLPVHGFGGTIYLDNIRYER